MMIKEQLGNVFFMLRPWWRYGKVLVTLMLVSSIILSPLAGYFSTTLAQTVIETAKSTGSFSKAFFIGLIYLIIFFVATIVSSGIDDLYTRWKKQYVEGRIDREVYDKASTMDYKNFDDPEFLDSYKISIERFSIESSQLIKNLFSFLSEIARCILYGILIVSQGVVLLAVVVACAAFTTYAQVYWSKVSVERETAMVRDKRRADYLQRLFYNKTAVADMRFSNVKSSLFKIFDDSIAGRIKIYRRFGSKEFFIDCLVAIAQAGTTFIIPIYIVRGMLLGNSEDIGIYATLIAASIAMKEALNAMGWWGSQISLGIAYAEKVKQFFNTESTVETSGEGECLSGDPFSICMRNVCFSYANSEFCIKNLNMSISPGQKIAIVGENGAGKTTLTYLLLRLFDVDSGEILINEQPIKCYDTKKLRERIGVAFQNSVTYAMTVRDNVNAYAVKPDSIVKKSLDDVGLKIELDSQLTKEFDENGIALSGGDSQKLCISRLLYNKYGLLILDEPSSALDPIAEYNLAKLIFNNSPTTTVMVAHRLSTIVDADMIYLFSDGKIIESGNHKQLMKKGGKYAEMFEKQAEGYVDAVAAGQEGRI